MVISEDDLHSIQTLRQQFDDATSRLKDARIRKEELEHMLEKIKTEISVTTSETCNLESALIVLEDNLCWTLSRGRYGS